MEQETLDMLHGATGMLTTLHDELTDLAEILHAVGLTKPAARADYAINLVSRASADLRTGTARAAHESFRASQQATTNMMNAILAVSSMKHDAETDTQKEPAS